MKVIAIVSGVLFLAAAGLFYVSEVLNELDESLEGWFIE